MYGASHTQFNVLNHVGFTLSYSSAVGNIKELGQEQLCEIISFMGQCAFMILWDTLNIVFQVGKQCKDSKDHFDNGTTATLIPLFYVEFDGLPLDLKSPQDNWCPVIDFTHEDLLPSSQQVQELEAEQLWHIEDILFNAFPDLCDHFKDKIKCVTNILPIPMHKTEQYPLPTIHIDKSSLEDVILCAGDQLTMSLLDKVSNIQY